MLTLPVPRCIISILIALSIALSGLGGTASARALPAAGQPATPPVDKPRPGVDPLPALEPPQATGTRDALLKSDPGDQPWSFQAYQSYRHGNWEIYLLLNLSSSPLRLTNHEATDQSPRIDAAGTRVVFISDRDGNDEIYRVNVDGSGLERLTNTRERTEVQPSWSPDGRRIAFAARLRNIDPYEIYTMDANGAGQTPVAAGSGQDNLYPAWSPDGRVLSWVRLDANGWGRIWVANPDGSGAHALSAPLRFLSSPKWSPDGTRLAFDADLDLDGWNELGVIQADGSGLQTAFDLNLYAVDAWMGSWSMNGYALDFSRLDYLLWEGQYYLKASDVYRFELGGNYAAPWTSDKVSMAPDYLSLDRSAPTVDLYALPEFTHAGSSSVSWSNQDTGGSGMDQQVIQKRLGPSGQWEDVFRGYYYSETGRTEFKGAPGEVVEFRMQVRDNAYNYSPWTDVVRTTVYAWDLAGQARDTRENALPGVNLQIDPAPLASVETNPGAGYHALLPASGVYALQGNHPGFKPLPASGIAISADQDYDAWLLPDDDLIENGGFEVGAGALPGWATSPAATLKTGLRDTGQYSALLGRDCPVPPCLSDPEIIPSHASLTFSLAADSRGRLHRILAAHDQVGIYHQVRLEDGRWTEPTLVPGSEANSSAYYVTDLAVDVNDNLYAVWSQWVSNAYVVFFSQLPASTGAWSQAVVLDQGSKPRIAVDQSGGVHLIAGTTAGLVYHERLPSGDWLPPVTLDPYQNPTADVAVGPDNRVHFAWYKASSDKLFYQVRQPNRAWDPIEILKVGGGFELTLLIDPQNTVHVLSGEEYTFRPYQGSWSAVEAPLKSTGSSQVRAAVDSRGSVYVIYATWNSRNYLVRRAGVWSGIQPVSTGSTHNYQVAIGPGDRFHILEEHDITGTAETRYYSDRRPAADNQEWLSQAVQVPAEMHRPTLSFWYSLSEGSVNPATGLAVQVVTPSASAEVFNTRETTSTNVGGRWQHAWVDLSAWAGQPVTVTITLRQAAGESYRAAGLDDVSLGSWLTPIVSQGTPAVIEVGWTGQTLTITGENFLPGAIVHIGDIPAESVEWLDESTLRATVPSGLAPGFYDLWVYNPGGQPGALAGGLRLGSHLFLPFVRR